MPDRLAVVIPIYDEAENVGLKLFSRLCQVFDRLTDFEPTTIYVNDGSQTTR